MTILPSEAASSAKETIYPRVKFSSKFSYIFVELTFIKPYAIELAPFVA